MRRYALTQPFVGHPIFWPMCLLFGHVECVTLDACERCGVTGIARGRWAALRSGGTVSRIEPSSKTAGKSHRDELIDGLEAKVQALIVRLESRRRRSSRRFP